MGCPVSLSTDWRFGDKPVADSQRLVQDCGTIERVVANQRSWLLICGLLSGNIVQNIAILSVVALLLPSAANAAGNSPEVILFSCLAVVIIVGLIALFHFSGRSTSSSSSEHVANQASLLYKLNYFLDQSAAYRIEVYRQSGNIERVEGPIQGKQVAEKILSSMRRASISAVSIMQSSDGIDVRRLVHNGRGRQEGKRIGSYLIVNLSTSGNSTSDVTDSPSDTSAQLENHDITVVVKSEAEAALIKSWYRIDGQISVGRMQSVRDFLKNFDPTTGVGEGTIKQTDFFVFLTYVDKFLVGTSDVSSEVREELGRSAALHHQFILKEENRQIIYGIETFNASPSEIQRTFIDWFNRLSFADVIRENRPKTLTVSLSRYTSVKPLD